MNKISKISQLVNTFFHQVKLAQLTDAEEKVHLFWNELKKYQQDIEGIIGDEESMYKEDSESANKTMNALQDNAGKIARQLSDFSEEELDNLADWMADTDSEDETEKNFETLESIAEEGVMKGYMSENRVQHTLDYLGKKMLEKLNKSKSQNSNVSEKSFDSGKGSSSSKGTQSTEPKYVPTALSYFNSLQAVSGFAKSRSQDFNPELKNKINERLQGFGKALEQYDDNDQEMPMHIAQQWAEPILIPVASLIATAKKNYQTETDKLWYNIAKNSGGQIPSGFSYGTWLTMKRIPYHQATAKDVAELAKLGIRIIPGEWIMPIEHIKKYPTPEQKAQMASKTKLK